MEGADARALSCFFHIESMVSSNATYFLHMVWRTCGITSILLSILFLTPVGRGKLEFFISKDKWSELDLCYGLVV